MNKGKIEKTEVKIEGNVRISIKNGVQYTNIRERQCKSLEEVVNLAVEKAYRDYVRNHNISDLNYADLEDMRSAAMMGAMKGVKSIAKKFGVDDLNTIDPTEDAYHAKAYVDAGYAIMTEVGKIRENVKLSERTKRQFAHCEKFLEEHEDGNYTEEELENLAKKCWTSKKSCLDILSDYKKFARTQFMSIDETRPGYEGDVTYEETVEAEETDEEKDAKTNAVRTEFLQKLLNECDKLYAQQKDLVVDYFGLFGNEKLTDGAIARKYGMKRDEVANAAKSAIRKLSKYVSDRYGYDCSADIFS